MAQAQIIRGFEVPTTFFEGLLSGLHHPAAGLDHLAFIVVLGVAAALTRAAIPMILAFLATAAIATYGRAVNLDYPYVEQLVALTVIAAGVLLALGLGDKTLIWLPFAAVAGVLHGYAFGEEVLGADGAVIAAYIIGGTVACAAIALLAKLVASWVPGLCDDAKWWPLRLAGVLVAVLGIYLFALLIIG
jgi:urease accessory protein